MTITIGAAAPLLAADAFVRGERRRCIDLAEFRGSWTVVAFGARGIDIHGFAVLEEAFAADGAVVLAATAADYHDVAARYADDGRIRFPIMCDVEETRRITLVVDPGGVVRHVGLERTARETLDALEALITERIALGRELRLAA